MITEKELNELGWRRKSVASLTYSYAGWELCIWIDDGTRRLRIYSARSSPMRELSVDSLACSKSQIKSCMDVLGIFYPQCEMPMTSIASRCVTLSDKVLVDLAERKEVVERLEWPNAAVDVETHPLLGFEASEVGQGDNYTLKFERTKGGTMTYTITPH